MQFVLYDRCSRGRYRSLGQGVRHGIVQSLPSPTGLYEPVIRWGAALREPQAPMPRQEGSRGRESQETQGIVTVAGASAPKATLRMPEVRAKRGFSAVTAKG